MTLTQQRQEYMRKFAGIKSSAEMATDLGISKTNVSVIAHKAGISLAMPKLKKSAKGAPKPKQKPVSRISAPTEKQIETMKTFGGKIPFKELAKLVGMSQSTLRIEASKRGIGIRFQKKPAPRAKKPKAPKPEKPAVSVTMESERKLEEASRLLRTAGWTVLRPDPFLTIDRQRLQNNNQSSAGSSL
ncbi:MAG: hypothetical protein Q8L20_11065 [Gammaproteobacteria bacterium]|nr:hypothetical protein [Gammaproteobacteria bacterium]